MLIKKARKCPAKTEEQKFKNGRIGTEKGRRQMEKTLSWVGTTSKREIIWPVKKGGKEARPPQLFLLLLDLQLE